MIIIVRIHLKYSYEDNISFKLNLLLLIFSNYEKQTNQTRILILSDALWHSLKIKFFINKNKLKH